MNIPETSPRKAVLFKAGLDVIIQYQGSKIFLKNQRRSQKHF